MNNNLAADFGPTAQAAPHPLVGILWLVIIIVLVTAMWKVFVKAGRPGWGVLIPVYNIYLLCKVAGKPGWWLILLFIPIVNFIISILLAVGISRNFGKGGGFAVGLFLLPFVFYPILAFGAAQYAGRPAS